MEAQSRTCLCALCLQLTNFQDEKLTHSHAHAHAQARMHAQKDPILVLKAVRTYRRHIVKRLYARFTKQELSACNVNHCTALDGAGMMHSLWNFMLMCYICRLF